MLLNIEKNFAQAIQRIGPSEKTKAGTLLSIIPDRTGWADFLVFVRSEWGTWENNFEQYPGCLVLLYCGLAFYEYEDKELWLHFEKAIEKSLPQNQRDRINAVFASITKNFGLKMKTRSNGTDFVGTAVYHIGIPLSLWDGFLEVCKWALWRKDWKTLSEEEWADAIDKRAGSRRRLKRFLVENRESASTFIREILEAREILNNDNRLTINDIAQASILRVEYFDEVPETAEFLRENNPDSLFQDRARLVWDDQRRKISLYLPAVKQEKLPANWCIGTHVQKANTAPDEVLLNAEAFHSSLLLSLQFRKNSEAQRLRGLEPWGLFDLESSGRQVVNPNRDELPLKNYLLVSKKQIDVISREGFDEDGNPPNEQFELSDGVTCFVTRLWPTGKYAELCLREQDGRKRTIRFRTKAKIEARFFAGKGEHAAYFSRLHDRVKLEQWPVLCVSIPRGYFRSNNDELDEKFKVFIDDNLADGQWECSTLMDDDREFYFWEWSSIRPVMEIVKSGIGKSLKDLDKFCRFPSLKGDRLLSIKSPEFTIPYKISKEEPKEGMGICWKNLPGAFLPWFLLCQSREGMKWDDLMLAKDIIAPNLRISHSLLRKYEDQGLLLQRGHKWEIRQSRVALKRLSDGRCQMEYCGDPSILWGLYRRMFYESPNNELPIIEIIDRKDGIPYLEINWHQYLLSVLEKYLRNQNVIIVRQLWTH